MLGALVGGVGGSITYLSLRREKEAGGFAPAAAAAADRYIEDGLWTWEFANQKLHRDPIYRHMLTEAELRGGSSIVDFGCGVGLALTLLRCADELNRKGQWPAGYAAPPAFARLIGVEPRTAVAGIAARAIGDAGAVVAADGRDFGWPPCDAVLFFDVLHLLPFNDQVATLAAARKNLSERGVILVREADAAMGWRFHLVRSGNFLRALARGRVQRHFYFRTAASWREVFTRAGFVSTTLRHESAFRANVAFRLELDHRKATNSSASLLP
jgi:SAM-dependent methyltransferase